MGQCLNCKKEIQEYTGRRPKKYCSDPCRQKFFQAKKKREKPKVISSTPERQDIQPEFMGHVIPKELTGLQLAVWKNNIKMGKKK